MNEVKIRKGSPISDLKKLGFLNQEDNGVFRVWEKGEYIAHETGGYVFDFKQRKKDPWAGLSPKGDVVAYLRQQQKK
ncbi:MAG: hypothetical protein WC822_01945 [Candidatus Paceibacterota bacterium]|jgi:hypothetical protein